MTQYKTLNAILSNSQLSKLKSGTKNGTQVTLKLSLNVWLVITSKLLLANTQFRRICEIFGNGLSANIKFSKSQLSKRGQSEGFLDRLLKAGLSLMKNVLAPLA